MHTKIHFHAGVSTSGGTIIELTHGEHRVVFDFGFVFDLPRHVFDGAIAPGRPSYLSDLLQLGMLPKIDGVFPAAGLRDDLGVHPADPVSCPTMVLISHPHEDHVGAIDLIDPSIPVVLSEQGATLLRTLRDVDAFPLTREIEGMALGEPRTFGPFEIVARYSDHPAWGSVGFEITSPDGRVFWTGDWRLHGKGRERVLRDLEQSAAAGIDLLITEGTSLGSALPDSDDVTPVEEGALELPNGLLTEEGVDAAFEAKVRAPGLVLLNIYHRDFSPLTNVIQLAKEHGRHVAVQPDIAVILERLTGELHPVFGGRDGITVDSQTPDAIVDLLDRAVVIDTDEILADPSAWLLQLGYAETPELLAFSGIEATYFHVGGMPLGGGTPEHTRLERVLQTTGIEYSQAGRHTHFAHATPGHINLMTRILQPSAVAVVHAPYAGMTAWQPPVGTRVEAEAGVVLELRAGTVSSAG